MNSQLRLAAVVLTITLVSSSGASLAKEESADQELLEKRSRIHPSYEPVDEKTPLLPIRSNNRSEIASETPSSAKPEKIEPPIETKELLEAVGLCMKVVSPQLDVKPQFLLDNGWGYGQLERKYRGALQYETVNYYKKNLTISLQDFTKFVDCRAAARIDGEKQLSEIRASLLEQLGATPVQSTPGLEPYVARTQQSAPQTNFENMLIIDDYLVEFWSQSISTADMKIEGPPVIELALMSISPLPEKFQTRNRAKATR